MPQPDSPQEPVAREAYKDALQPAAQEFGHAVRPVGQELAITARTIAKAINVALEPIAALIWGWEKIREYLIPALEKRLERLNPTKIQTPSPLVAGPSVEALRYAGHEPTLRELFANLLATAMDADRATDAHPSFVDIVRQLDPDEARILSLIAKEKDIMFVDIVVGDDHTYELGHFSLAGYRASCLSPLHAPQYLENVARLGIIQLREDEKSSTPDVRAYGRACDEYGEILSLPIVVEAAEQIRKSGRLPYFRPGRAALTEFGKQFTRACLSLQ